MVIHARTNATRLVIAIARPLPNQRPGWTIHRIARDRHPTPNTMVLPGMEVETGKVATQQPSMALWMYEAVKITQEATRLKTADEVHSQTKAKVKLLHTHHMAARPKTQTGVDWVSRLCNRQCNQGAPCGASPTHAHHFQMLQAHRQRLNISLTPTRLT